MNQALGEVVTIESTLKRGSFGRKRMNPTGGRCSSRTHIAVVVGGSFPPGISSMREGRLEAEDLGGQHMEVLDPNVGVESQ